MAQQSQKQHLWLSQVEISGIVFSEPILADSAPEGFRILEKKEKENFRNAFERWQLPKNMVQGDPHKDWIEYIIESILRLDKSYWIRGADIDSKVTSRIHETNETLRPHQVLIEKNNQNNPTMLMFIMVIMMGMAMRICFVNINQSLIPIWQMEPVQMCLNLVVNLLPEVAGWIIWAKKLIGKLVILTAMAVMI